VSSHHGIRLHQYHRVNTAGPEAIEQNPEYAVDPSQPDPSVAVTSKNFQLVAESHHLDLQIGKNAEARENTVKEGKQNPMHAPTLRASNRKTSISTLDEFSGRDSK